MAKSLAKKIALAYLVLMVVGSGLCVIIEPGLSAAAEETDTVEVNLTVSGTISISSPSDVTMSPDITGTGSSTGSAEWTVTTNNAAGYKLEVEADTTPAMQSGSDSFADYTEASAGTPEAWSIATTASEFGFTVSGTDSETDFSSGTLYRGFTGTTKIQAAHASAETSGTATTVGFKAEVGSAYTQPTGSYNATITATATTL